MDLLNTATRKNVVELVEQKLLPQRTETVSSGLGRLNTSVYCGTRGDTLTSRVRDEKRTTHRRNRLHT